MDLDDDQKKKAGAVTCCILLPTIIGLIAGSFGTVADTDMCLQYNTITQEMESKPTENQGTVFIGVDGALVCFP